MRNLLLIFCLFIFSNLIKAKDLAMFSGRILSSDFKSGFVKVKIDFSNSRFLQKGNKVVIWPPDVEFKDHNSCSGLIVGKSPKYVLLRFNEIEVCKKIINFTGGQTISLKSEELKENILTAEEMNKILSKKRLALASKVKTLKDLLDTHPEKINSINSKYDTLIKKLNYEWKMALENAQEENIYNIQEYKNYASRLDEVDFKMEQYHIENDNFFTDRWSLDPSLYYKK